jgi:hypothetical protein
MFANALAPENLVVLIEQNDADIRAITFPVEHGEATFQCLSGNNSFIVGLPRKERWQR